ncbi:MAG: hypothetical protein ACRENN_05325 [Candidatus Eiseniibacteriota bacterium]
MVPDAARLAPPARGLYLGAMRRASTLPRFGLALGIVGLSLGIPGTAAAGDSWLAADKQLHATGSLAIAASLRVCGGTEWQSFGGTVGIGILKEGIDAARKSKRGGRGASVKDLIADIVGAAAGIAIVAAMDR